ncbi:MAG: hypothetical protein JNM13_00110 [Hyphomicrobiaceae bacterium]|nr:hypothetical protein [Hyphomicrobiaceae bacterium]
MTLDASPPPADAASEARIVTSEPEAGGADRGRRGLAISIVNWWLIIAAGIVFFLLMVFAGLNIGAALLGFAGITSVVWLVGSLERPQQAAVSVGAGRIGRWPDSGLRTGLDAIDQPCVLVDATGITRHVNPEGVVRFAGLRTGFPLSFGLRTTVVLDAFTRLAAGGGPETVEWTERVPTERWFRAVLTPIRLPIVRETDPGPAPDFVLLRIIDRTEAYLVERMRVDFIANASHELRTPLASLIGFVETLQGPARDDPNARAKFLAIMLDQANRMKRLIDDLLSLSRVEMKAHVRPDTPLDLAVTCRHVVDALGPVAAEAGVSIETDITSEAAVVLGDRDELVQVISNLIENAIKYGGEARRVRLGLRRESLPQRGAQVVIEVQDWGPGIAIEHVPRLTERFYRAGNAQSREKKGTGLGLAIVKHILARHRGQLKIDSEVGRGSTFQVRLEAAATSV